MIPVSIGEETHSIQSSWSEVSVDKFSKLMEEDLTEPFKIISVLTGLEYNQVIRIDVSQLNKNVVPLLGWLNDSFKLDELAMPSHIKIGEKFIPVPFDIKEESVGQKNMVQTAMTSDKDSLALVSYAVSVYLYFKYFDCGFEVMSDRNFDKKIDMFTKLIYECSITEVYPVGVYFLAEIKKIVETEGRIFKPNYTNDEIAAGIQNFERFGIINMIRALSKDMRLTFDQTLMLDYNTAFVVLQMMQEERKFRVRYSEILKENQKKQQ